MKFRPRDNVDTLRFSNKKGFFFLELIKKDLLDSHSTPTYVGICTLDTYPVCKCTLTLITRCICGIIEGWTVLYKCYIEWNISNIIFIVHLHTIIHSYKINNQYYIQYTQSNITWNTLDQLRSDNFSSVKFFIQFPSNYSVCW